MNMKLDLVQEGITTNFNSQEIIRIMEDTNLNSDAKCRRLFDRGEDYLSHVQWLCFRKTDQWIQYLVDHNFVTPNFKSLWEENRNEAWNELSDVVDVAEELNNASGKRTLFLDNRNWTNEEQPCTLEQSWDYYVVEGEANGNTKERKAENWFTHIKYSVSHIEDQGITQEKPKKRLGFFNESKKLTEEISNDWCRQELGIDYDTLFDLADTNFCCDWEDGSLDPFCVSWTHPEYEHARTGIVSPWYDNCGRGPFRSLQEMCDFYGEEFVKDWLTEFVKWLEAHHLWEKPKPKLGFFDK